MAQEPGGLDRLLDPYRVLDPRDRGKRLCSSVAGKLDTLSFDRKGLALTPLQLKVVGGLGGVKLFGAIPSVGDLDAATGRTWGC